MTAYWLIISGFTAIIFLYFFCIVFLAFKLNKTKEANHFEHNIKTDIIIAFRNEEQNIANLIDDLNKQSCSNCKFILVDDHSTDKSFEMACLKTSYNQRFVVLQLPPGMFGKKQALEYGIKRSNSKYILFTDADCRLNTNWVSTIVSDMSCYNLDFCSGAFLIHNYTNTFQKLQAIETLFLTAVGHALISLGKPVLCNGANMAIIRGHNEIPLLNNISSGDDIFRLQHAVMTNRKVWYTTAKNTLVYSKAEPTLSKLIQQKVRWIGKAKHYSDKFSMVFTAFVALTQITLIISVFCFPAKIWVSLWVVKILSEIILITKAINVYEQKFSLLHILLVGVLYPIYSTIIGIFSIFYVPQWKGRTIKT